MGQADNVNYTGLASRGDWAPDLKNRFSFSWNWSHFIENAQDWTYASSPGMQDWDNIRTARGGILNWTYSKSSATVISASVSANQWLNVQETLGVRKYKPSDIGFPTYLDARCQALGGCAVPLVTLNGFTSAYGGNSLVMGRTLSGDVRQRSTGLKASVSHVRGSHSIQGGIDFRQAYATNTGGAGNSMGNFTFNSKYVQKNDDGLTPAGSLGLSYAAFMLGIPSSMSSDNNASYALMNPYYAWYGQDTWRVTRNLTVTLGLRVEYEQAPTERYNRALTYFDPTIQLPIAAAAQAAYAANPVPELAASALYGAGRVGLRRCEWRPAPAMAERTDVAAAAFGRLAVEPQDDSPRRLRYLLRFDQRAERDPQSVGFLAHDFHQPDQRFRGQLAGRKSRSRRIPAGGSLSRPQRRDSFRCASGKLAGRHVCRRTGLLLLSPSTGSIPASSSGGSACSAS